MYKIIISFFMLTMLGAGMYAQKSSIKSVKIGNQVWMAKNLDVTTFRNGDPIPEANTIELWMYYDNNKLPAFCYYNHDKKTKNKYGVIYNRFVTSDPRGIAPQGYKVPDRRDWDILKQYVGGSQNGRSLMGRSGWFKNLNGT
ncbi:MAG: FISUMP domain-containing protein, partial [Ignavibacteria bacterium]